MHPLTVRWARETIAAFTAAMVSARRRPIPRVMAQALAVSISAVLLGGTAAAIGLRAEPNAGELASAVQLGLGRTADQDPAVAPPVRIEIPSLGVSAPVDELGLQPDGTMAVPSDFARTGWFSGLEAPGQTGTAVIVGHLDSHTGPAVFYRLSELRAGHEVIVVRADGTSVTFVVERNEKYDKRRFPTIAVYAPASRPTLRLITCAGDFDRKHRHYSDNVVVYASAQEAK